jgi:hypothetical protein
LNKIRLVYANDLKGISKMKKEDIINLLIKYNFDVSNLSASKLRAKKKPATEKELIDASKIIAEIPKAKTNASVTINKGIKQKLARKNLIKEHQNTMFFKEMIAEDNTHKLGQRLTRTHVCHCRFPHADFLRNVTLSRG